MSDDEFQKLARFYRDEYDGNIDVAKLAKFLKWTRANVPHSWNLSPTRHPHMKKLICLCVIVGNEEAVIERFIRSFAKVADEMRFALALGQALPDKTRDIIKAVCAEIGMPCAVTEYYNKESWKHVDDFAAARNLVWKDPYPVDKFPASPRYLIWADCDDLIDDESAQLLRDAAETGEKDLYVVPYEVRGKAQIIYRERMARNDGCSFWRFPVHELLGFKREVTYGIVKDAAIVHAPQADKPSFDGRNRVILEHAIQDGARHLFFLSQEAVERGQIDDFRAYAAAALAHPGLEETERYEILINLAQNEPDKKKARGHAEEAFGLMPDRREAMALLACYALVDERNEEAFHLAKLMATIPMPKKAYWTLNREWYTWKGFYLLTQTMRKTGREKQALQLEEEQFEKSGKMFSVIHPTYLRPHQALAIRDIYLSRARNPMAVEYIFGIHHDDKESLYLLSGYRHVVTDKEGCCPNTLEPMRQSSGKFIMVIADDLFPPDGWDEQILKALYKAELDWRQKNLTGYQLMPDSTWHYHPFVLNFSDGLRSDGHMCHAFMTRPWAEEILADPWPGTGIFSDNEFTHRARKAGIVIDAPEIVFEHRHFINGKAPMDDTYKDQNQVKNYQEGRKLLIERNPDLIVPELPPSASPVPINLFPILAGELMQKRAMVTFLQIGAHDGLNNDPIRPFVDNGSWRGIFVEPQPEIFKRLQKNYEDISPSRVAFENCAIAREDGEVTLYAFALNQGLPDHATMLCSLYRTALTSNGHGYKGDVIEIKVPALTLASLFKKYDITNLDVMQIDTEGFDFEIIKMLSETTIRPALIHFEHSFFGYDEQAVAKIRACYELLAGLGYRVTPVGNDTVAYLQSGDGFEKIVANDGYEVKA